MAKSNAGTSEQQTQQSQPQSRNAAATGQPGAVATRRQYDATGFPLPPFSLLGLNPFSLMGRLMDQLDYVPRAESSAAPLQWVPAIEIAERDGNLMVRADLPGVKPDNIRVEARDGALLIEGESRIEHEEDRAGIHRSERRYGRFVRSIPLPDGAKIDQATATLDSGVLEITIPVEEQQSSNQRQIPVQTNGENTGQNAQQSGSGQQTSAQRTAQKSS